MSNLVTFLMAIVIVASDVSCFCWGMWFEKNRKK